jgi:hypothetical protein
MKIATPKVKSVVYAVRIVKRGEDISINVRGSEDPEAIVNVLRRAADLVEMSGKTEAEDATDQLPLE